MFLIFLTPNIRFVKPFIHIYIYKYKCHCYQQCYIGSSSLQLFVRSSKHVGRSFCTDFFLTSLEKSAIRDHNDSKKNILMTNFSILGNTNNIFDFHILEYSRLCTNLCDYYYFFRYDRYMLIHSYVCCFLFLFSDNVLY